MDNQQLKAFLGVAKYGSFSKAAHALFLTQPAISKRIATLESELNTQLFNRLGHNIQLTQAGIALLPKAKTILAEFDDAKRVVGNLSGDIAGILKIGTSHHIGLHRLAPVLKSFTQQYPQVQLDIHFVDSEKGCHAVASGELELAVVTLPSTQRKKLTQTLIWHDPLSIVIAPNHPLARKIKQNNKMAVSIYELVQYPAILPAMGTFTRDIIENASQLAKAPVNISMETNYLETIKMMVSIGLGWSALPNNMLDQSLIAAHISDLKLERQLGVVTHHRRTLSNAAHALIAILLKHAS